MEPWREKVVGLAQGFMGTPYVPRGMCPGLALDCGTLLWHVYREIIPLPAFPADYPADWALHNVDTRYLDWIAPFVQEVQHPIRGGISVWKYGRSFSHGAIVVDRKNVIHAWGRQAFGCVQKSHTNFFRVSQERREVKHFDLEPSCLLVR
jgi:cell wall-associated NlpC family hydrolase